MKTIGERAAFLEKVPVFTGLRREALEILATAAEVLELPAEAAVVTEGEMGSRMFVVIEGSVRVCKRQDGGQRTVLGELGPGAHFGEMSIVECVERSASVVTREPSRLLVLRSTDFLHLYQANPAQYAMLVLNLARDLSRRLRRIDERFAAISS